MKGERLKISSKKPSRKKNGAKLKIGHKKLSAGKFTKLNF